VRREGERVRLFSRHGHDWTERYPAIAAGASSLRARSLSLDGEAVVCRPDGVAVFNAINRPGIVAEAMLYAFDILEFNGEDLRPYPLANRKPAMLRAWEAKW
jgi:bifunctional non-homologous end joining protein LigD